MQLTEKQKSEGWCIVKFGDVAQEVRASTKDPLGAGIDYYIGLEHIDPESLRVARWGSIATDNPTFTKKFRAGDILFGRRRAYLKKAAVAEFDGICSGDIIVIAPKGEMLAQGLLPFIVQSEPFFDWAIKHSAGGLSPRTKFNSLADFEFQLPPLTRQKEMLKTLYSVENTIKSTECFLQSLNTYQSKLLARLFRGQHPAENRSLDYTNLKLENIVELAYGKSPQGIKCDDGNNSIYGTGGIIGLTNQKLSNGPTIIIGRKGTLDKPIFVEEDFWAIDTTYYCINLHDTVLLKWLYYYFCALDLKKYDESSGVPSLARNTLYKISLKIPSLEDQKMYVSINERLDSLRETQTNHLGKLKILKNKLTVKYLSNEAA
ncbi:TPA: hypothetical protein I8Y75_001365 [Legionella pneumophila]|nr:hypothetical protein [Legionella pneumophila]